MKSMSQQQELYNKAMESGGALEEANSVKAESLEGKINKLSNTTKQMWSSFINSDMLKGGIDGLTILIEKFGNLPTIIGLATTALIAFKGKAIATFLTSLPAMISQIVAYQTALGATSTATALLSHSMNSLKAVFMSNPFGIIAIAITAFITYMTMAKSTTDKLKESFEEFDKSKEDMNKVTQGEDLVKQYQELEEKINSNTLSTDEMISSKKELKSIQEQLAKQFPDLVSGYDKEGNAIVTNLEKVNKKIGETKENVLSNLSGSLTTSLSEFNGDYFGDSFAGSIQRKLSQIRMNKNKDEYEEQYELEKKYLNLDEGLKFNSSDLYKYYVELDKVQKLEDGQIGLNKEQREEFKELRNSLETYNEELGEYKSYLKEDELEEKLKGKKYFNFDTGEFEDAYEYFQKNKDSEEDLTKATEDLADAQKDLSESSETLKKQIEDLADAFSNLTSEIDIIDKVIEEMQKYGGITSSTYATLLKDHPEVIKALMKEGDTIQNLTELREKDVEKQKKAQEDAINNILNTNFDESGKPVPKVDTSAQEAEKQKSEETKAVVQQTESEKQQAYEDTKNQELKAIAETESMFENYNVLKQNSDIDLNNTIRTNSSNTTNELKGNYQTDAGNFENAEQAKRQSLMNTQKAMLESAVKSDNMYDRYEKMKALQSIEGIENADMTKQNNGYTKQLEEAGFVYNGGEWVLKGSKQKTDEGKKTVDDLQKKLDEINEKYKNSSPTLINNKEASEIDEALKNKEKDYSVEDVEDLTDAYHDLNNAITLVEAKLKQLQARYENLYGKSKAQAMQEQVDILKQQLDLHSQMESKINSELAKQRSELASQGVTFDSSGMISNYNEILTSLRNQANAIQTVDENSKKAKENAKTNLTDLQKKMNDYNNTITKDLEEQKTTWLELQNQIKETYKTMEKMVTDGESKVTDVIKNEIDKRKEKEKEAVEEELKQIDKVKEALQDQWDTDDYEDQLQEAQDKVMEYEEKIREAIKNGDMNSLTDLKKEQQDALKELNDTVKQHERDMINDEIDDQSDALNKKSEEIDKKYEEMEKSENLTKMVTEALQTGFFKINDEVISLSSAMSDFVKESTVGIGTINQTTRELNQTLADTLAMLNQLGGYNGLTNLLPNVPYQMLANSTGTIDRNTIFTNNGNNTRSISIKLGDMYVNGNLDNVTLEDVNNTISKRFKEVVGNYIS